MSDSWLRKDFFDRLDANTVYTRLLAASADKPQQKF